MLYKYIPSSITPYFSYRMDKEISELNSSILEDIKQMFDEYNSYAKLYRMVRDKLETNDMSNMKLRIIGKNKIKNKWKYIYSHKFSKNSIFIIKYYLGINK